MSQTKIGTFEAVSLVCIIVLNHLISTLPKKILSSCGSASILNVLFICLLAGIFAFFIIRVMKKFPNHDILDISDFLGGKVLKVIIGILFFVLFIGSSSILLRTFVDGLRLTYFTNFSTPTILLVFLIGICIISLIKASSLIKCNALITIIMAFSLLVPLVSITPNFAFQRIFPILGFGTKETFLTGASNLFAFSGLSVLYFLPPLLKNQKDFKKVTILSVCLTGIFLLISVASLLLSIPFVFNTQELSPIYLLVRSFEFGNFLQRPEGIFTLIWALSIISYVSICIMFGKLILQKLLNLKHPNQLSYCLCTLLFALAILPANMAQLYFIEATIYQYYTLTLTFVLSFFLLILASYKKSKREKKKGSESYEST